MAAYGSEHAIQTKEHELLVKSVHFALAYMYSQNVSFGLFRFRNLLFVYFV